MGSAGSERVKYERKDKELFYNSVHNRCLYSFIKSSYSNNYEATEKAVNGKTEIVGRAQRVESGITRCATTLSNFCMKD